jgi:hypothetical protein
MKYLSAQTVNGKKPFITSILPFHIATPLNYHISIAVSPFLWQNYLPRHRYLYLIPELNNFISFARIFSLSFVYSNLQLNYSYLLTFKACLPENKAKELKETPYHKFACQLLFK